MPEGSNSLDIFGLKPIAEAASALTKGGIDAAGAFLGRICLPAAEEFGLMLRDRVSAWRAQNAAAIANKAERISTAKGTPVEYHALPRLVGSILAQGSWTDSDEVQDLWAGLLASSCDASGTDESNLMFVDLLTRLSVSQVRILRHAVSGANKTASGAGWLLADQFSVECNELLTIAGLADLQRLDRELDHLRSLGLLDLHAGFNPQTTFANVTPSALALHMVARANGHRGSPLEYFGIVSPTT